MTQGEYTRLVAQIAVLKEIAEEYSGKTIDNIIVQMEARRKDVENHPETVSAMITGKFKCEP